MENWITCKNCGTPNQGKFCTNCGQKIYLTPITFKDIGGDFMVAFVNYEAPFPKTFGNLFVKPGHLIRAYLAGQRKTFFSPVRYLLLALAISILVVKLLDYDPVQFLLQMEGQADTERQNSVSIIAGKFLHRNINFFILIFPFVIGFVTKLFYYKAPYRMAERIAFGFFISGQFLILTTLMIPVILLIPAFFNFNALVILLYLTYAYYSFYQPKMKFLGAIKSFFAAFFSFFIYVIITFVIALQIVKQFNIQ